MQVAWPLPNCKKWGAHGAPSAAAVTEPWTHLVALGVFLLARLLQGPAPDEDREDRYRYLPVHQNLCGELGRFSAPGH